MRSVAPVVLAIAMTGCVSTGERPFTMADYKWAVQLAVLEVQQFVADYRLWLPVAK